MSEITAARDAEVASEPVALDRVMLAMDVVDTLRHQQALVDAELNDDRRRQQFVARVQAIYRSQGIEVEESVIHEGVRALEENRFVYTPPARTWSVRLAEVYVERGKWARRAALVLLLVGAIWAAFAVPAHFQRRSQIDRFAAQVDRLVAVAEARTRQADDLISQVQRAHQEGEATVEQRLLGEAAGALVRGRERAVAIGAELTPRPDAETYPEERAAWDARLDTFSTQLEQVGGDLGTARGLIAAVQHLRELGTRLAVAMRRLHGLELSGPEQAQVDALQRDVLAAMDKGDGKAGERALQQLDARISEILAARQRQADLRAAFAGLATALDGVDVEAGAKAEMVQLQTSVEQAMAAGDWDRAGQQIAALRALVAELDQSYELRIVSRPNDQSGVWRYEASDRSKRNYYIVVEAIGGDGRPLTLPVTNEETQQTRKVRRFAIRVPQSVYEQVKADKLDNGLVDDVVFGSKRRGAREPEYRFPVAGGRITEW
ncbi:MAG: hypothetical protein H6838_07735 [Planctomycetes bacterium]|nr:hypothetical protein [Planctomycetota bacterium]